MRPEMGCGRGPSATLASVGLLLMLCCLNMASSSSRVIGYGRVRALASFVTSSEDVRDDVERRDWSVGASESPEQGGRIRDEALQNRQRHSKPWLTTVSKHSDRPAARQSPLTEGIYGKFSRRRRALSYPVMLPLEGEMGEEGEEKVDGYEAMEREYDPSTEAILHKGFREPLISFPVDEKDEGGEGEEEERKQEAEQDGERRHEDLSNGAETLPGFGRNWGGETPIGWHKRSSKYVGLFGLDNVDFVVSTLDGPRWTDTTSTDENEAQEGREGGQTGGGGRGRVREGGGGEWKAGGGSPESYGSAYGSEGNLANGSDVTGTTGSTTYHKDPPPLSPPLHPTRPRFNYARSRSRSRIGGVSSGGGGGGGRSAPSGRRGSKAGPTVTGESRPGDRTVINDPPRPTVRLNSEIIRRLVKGLMDDGR